MSDETSVIINPWDEVLANLIDGSGILDFMSPFITQPGIEHILKSDIDVRGITDMKPERFVRGASDIIAVKKLIERGTAMKSFRGLHAKVFLFDEAAIVTSANLTEGGLRRNWEYGILLRQKKTIDRIRMDFERTFESGVAIDGDDIVFVTRIIENTPIERREIQIETTNEEFVSEQAILQSLTGWKKEVYRVVEKLPDDRFTLGEVLEYETHFVHLYPDNRNIDAKIRQILQQLRDLGLIEFIDYQGTYRRLI